MTRFMGGGGWEHVDPCLQNLVSHHTSDTFSKKVSFGTVMVLSLLILWLPMVFFFGCVTDPSTGSREPLRSWHRGNSCDVGWGLDDHSTVQCYTLDDHSTVQCYTSSMTWGVCTGLVCHPGIGTGLFSRLIRIYFLSLRCISEVHTKHA